MCGDDAITAIAGQVLGGGGIDRVMHAPCCDADAPDVMEREVKAEGSGRFLLDGKPQISAYPQKTCGINPY